MNIQIPNGFEFQGIYCYPNVDQPFSYYYLPLRIQPQRGADETPIVNLISLGTGGYLQLSVSWDPPSKMLDALREEIARRENLENPAVLRMAFAPVTVEQVLLLLGDGSGEMMAIATQKSSGYPPYNALFNVQLNAAQQAQVAAALNGREDFLQIEYQVDLNGLVEASVTLTGDASRMVAQFKENQQIPDQAEVQKALETAILEGQFQITTNVPEGCSPTLVEQVKVNVLYQGAALLLRFLQGEKRIPDITQMKVAVSKTEPQTIPLQFKADVANWFTQGSGLDQIQPAPGIIPPTPNAPTLPPADTPSSLSVHLNFQPTDAPIAVVTLRQALTKIALTTPDFSATLSDLHASEPLEVETSYTTGGTYLKKLAIPESGELVLSPADLGLAEVTVDATALEKAGAEKARIWLRYRPQGDGISDETTVYLRDRSWQAHWFVISQNDNLQGLLEYKWQVTLGNSDLIKYEMAETTSQNIVLTLDEQQIEKN